MRNYFWKGFAAAIIGSGIGIWFIWQDTRDEHMFAMYDCAHAHANENLSLEEAYIQCEKAAR